MSDPSTNAHDTAAGRFLAPLIPALHRLDQMLERATAAADVSYGARAAADPYRGLYISAEQVEQLLAREPGVPGLASGGADGLDPIPADSRFAKLRDTFGLIDFDVDALLIALAPEIDLRYERLFAYLQDDVTRRRPSVDLILNLLCATRDAKFAARSRFMPGSPLLAHRLISLTADNGGHGPLLAHFVRIDDSAARFLLGHDTVEDRLSAFAELLTDEAEPKPDGLDSRLVDRLRRAARHARETAQPLRIYLEGPRGVGKRAYAQVIASTLDSPLLIVDAARAAESSGDFEAALRYAIREARVRGAVVYLTGVDALRAEPRWPMLQSLVSVLRDYPAPLVISGEKAWTLAQLPPGAGAFDAITVCVPEPGFEARRRRWTQQLAASGFAADDELAGALASRFLLSFEQIDAAVAYARGQRTFAESEPDFFTAARAQARHDLGTLARKVRPSYSWDDIILPPDQVARLRELCAQARHRHIVYGEWGFGDKLSLGKGLSALFSGPPGTGKTMAAEVIARELQLDLYKIDLSQVVSKYIGETEKNLNRIFAEARASNAIIFFDEADALFGKRSEVKDAHDRYANIEVAYLLQKMDEYEGISILATNLRQNLDPAFSRRLSFTIEFPFPDEHSRRRIWKTIWPRETPLREDADLEFMATQFKLSGGSVKNIALAAAFLAAEDRSGVSIVHLLRATRREYEKMGRSVSRAEFGKYWEVLERKGVFV